MMKTAITVLQELMVKYTDTPKYECIAQSGPQHLATFEYRCSARGHVVTATARSKKEAKQEAARLVLRELAAAGLPVPAPYGGAAPVPDPAAPHPADAAAAAIAAKSYKALLKELCEEYQLPAPAYTLEGDTGPAHARRFTARGAVGAHARAHTAPTKKAAQQGAAHQLYLYLRENLARLTHDFVEEEALARAHERAMERYVAAREDAAWRPDLKQRVQDYHLDAEQLDLGAAALAAGATGAEDAGDAEASLRAAAAALGLAVSWHSLAVSRGAALQLVRLAPAWPPLVFAAATRAAAAAEALGYLRLSMKFKDEVAAAHSERNVHA